MTSANKNQKESLIRRYPIVGSRRWSNYWWATVIFLGAIGFLLTGISSYVGAGSLLLPFLNEAPTPLVFFPQGLVMCFYGILGLFFSLYLWFTVFWSIGGGFNEFNKKDGTVRVFRWGFPGKNRRIDLRYPIKDVEAIRVEFIEGFNPRRTIFIRLKGKRDIPLTRIVQPLTFEQIEKQASDLAKFLQVNLVVA